VFVVDNGSDFNMWNYGGRIHVLTPGENLGWTGGLHYALKQSDAPFVLFMNDDAEFERKPDGMAKLLSHFDDPSVAAVGPATGTCMGRQSVEGPDIEDVKVLVGFCMLVRREHLERVGGVLLDWDLGDDIDLCIRFTQAGLKLLIDRRVFVYHHAFKTGVRVHGQPRVPGGWNSIEMVSATTQKLILKHGAAPVLEALGAEATPEGTRSLSITLSTEGTPVNPL
jgi:GT2 family glycosyltransferase